MGLRRPVVRNRGAVRRPVAGPRPIPFLAAASLAARASPSPTRDAFAIGDSNPSRKPGCDGASFPGTRSPVEGPPVLAIEVISPSNLAQDTLKKVSQYLAAGSGAVWLVYPALGIVEVHKPGAICQIKVPDSLTEEWMFGGRKFTLALTPLFTDPRGQP